MPVDCAKRGVKLTVQNDDGTQINCVATEMPFYDTEKKVRGAKG